MQQSSSSFSSSPAKIPSTGFSIISPSSKSAKSNFAEAANNFPEKTKNKSSSLSESSSESSFNFASSGGFVVHLDDKMLASSPNPDFHVIDSDGINNTGSNANILAPLEFNNNNPANRISETKSLDDGRLQSLNVKSSVSIGVSSGPKRNHRASSPVPSNQSNSSINQQGGNHLQSSLKEQEKVCPSGPAISLLSALSLYSL